MTIFKGVIGVRVRLAVINPKTSLQFSLAHFARSGSRPSRPGLRCTGANLVVELEPFVDACASYGIPLPDLVVLIRARKTKGELRTTSSGH